MSRLPPSALLGTTIYGNGDPFYDQSDLPGTASNPGVVSNTGTIQTDNLGSVFLIGPQAENGGTIVSPMGQIGLVAGTSLSLEPPVNGSGNEPQFRGVCLKPGGGTSRR
jgi:hypothetical protein